MSAKIQKKTGFETFSITIFFATAHCLFPNTVVTDEL